MKRFSIYYIVLISVLTLTSCFEMMEDIAVHADGSGSYKFIVNLSQSKNQIDKIRTQDSILHFAVPTLINVDSKLSEVEKKISAINGISNVTVKKDHINYIYQISCDFKNIESVNAAISTIWKTYDKGAPASYTLYSFDNNQFKRNTNSAPIEQFIRNAGSKEIEVCQKSTYTVICRFDTPILTNSSMNYTLSPTKKNALYKSDVWTTMADKTKSSVVLTVTP